MTRIVGRSVLSLLLVGALLVVPVGSAGADSSDPFMVQDINPGPGGSNPSHNMTDFQGRLFFEADDGIHGIELWVSDGTAAGTVLLKDINPGPGSSIGGGRGEGDHAPNWFTVVGENLFFRPDDGIHGRELWVTDGTAAGTKLVQDINPGPDSSNLGSLTVFDGRLYFSADDGIHGSELWVTDGTTAGTKLLKDINPGPDHSVISRSCERGWGSAEFEGRLFFSADDGVHGCELWVTDGTEAGTVLLKDISFGNSIPTAFTVAGGKLFFWAKSPGPQLWVTDGTEAGTFMVRVIHASNNASFALPNVLMTEFEGMLFFGADDGVNGTELWVSDGTEAGTMMVKDINPSRDGCNLYQGQDQRFCADSGGAGSLTVFDGRLFFAADDGINGKELWVTDGTEAGTVLFKDTKPGPDPSAFSGPVQLTVIGEKLFFAAERSSIVRPKLTSAKELWVSDGTTEGTMMIKDLEDDWRSASFVLLAGFEGKLYIEVRRSLFDELWVSDGTAAGTVLVIPGSLYTRPLTMSGGGLFFVADDGVHGRELWVLLGDTEAMPDLAMFNPNSGRWRLRHGAGDIERFSYGLPGDIPLMGDWDCDGTDTVAVYRESTGVFHYRNSNDFGVADGSFSFGDPGDVPIAGDWDGDGCDTIGVYRNGQVLLRNTLDTGPATTEYLFGAPGDRPFTGDFDGDGIDTVGLHRPSTGLVYIGNSQSTGVADIEFVYGISSDLIIAGDWDSDGDDSVGIHRPSDHTFRLSFDNRPGMPDAAINWGHGPWLPVGPAR